MNDRSAAGALELLLRRGGNAQVAGKKVLLAALATAEARRLGLLPTAAEIETMTVTLRRELELESEVQFANWLLEAGLEPVEFESVMADFAAILAVEAHHQTALNERRERHGRLLAARESRLAGISKRR